MGLAVMVGLFALAGVLGRQRRRLGQRHGRSPVLHDAVRRASGLGPAKAGRIARPVHRAGVQRAHKLHPELAPPELHLRARLAGRPDGGQRLGRTLQRNLILGRWRRCWVRSAFRNDLLASPRFGLITHFPDGRVIDTSPVEHLGVTSPADGFVIVPATMPLARSRNGTRRRPGTCIQVRSRPARDLSWSSPRSSPPDRRVANKLRRKMAGRLGTTSHAGSPPGASCCR